MGGQLGKQIDLIFFKSSNLQSFEIHSVRELFFLMGALNWLGIIMSDFHS